MIDILKHVHENYVPQVKLEDGTIEVKTKVLLILLIFQKAKDYQLDFF